MSKMVVPLKYYFRRLFTKLHLVLIRIIDVFTAGIVECSVGDIMLKRGEIYHNQFLVASRVMDAKGYLDSGKAVFPYRAEISRAVSGDFMYDIALKDSSFANLIESYQKDGYKEEYYLEADADFCLVNGNHRCSLNYLFDVRKTRILFSKRHLKFDKGIDWYVSHEVSHDTIRKVLSQFEEMQKVLVERGDCFCALVEGDELAELLTGMVNVLDRQIITIDKDTTVLSIFLSAGQYYLFKYSLSQPEYIVQKKKLVSKRNLEIADALKKRSLVAGIEKSFTLFGNSCLDGRMIYEAVSERNSGSFA